jgi:hypothetical protein
MDRPSPVWLNNIELRTFNKLIFADMFLFILACHKSISSHCDIHNRPEHLPEDY